MSGFFKYKNHGIGEIAKDIEVAIKRKKYSEEVTIELRAMIELLKILNKLTQQADYFLSGDDSEANFLNNITKNLDHPIKSSEAIDERK